MTNPRTLTSRGGDKKTVEAFTMTYENLGEAVKWLDSYGYNAKEARQGVVIVTPGLGFNRVALPEDVITIDAKGNLRIRHINSVIRMYELKED